jgi:hypothetical protein
MRIITASVVFLLILSGCNYSKSVKKDLISGLYTTGDGLKCDDVYITAGEGTVTRNTFVYGEKFVVNFNNIEGFTRENEAAFPDMTLYVVSSAGDTALYAGDLYGNNTDGFKISPLLLNSDVTVASPMKSGGSYKLFVKISDRKGTGKFSAEFAFNIIPNEALKVEATGVKYNEIYLYSKERGLVLTDNKAKFNENVYFILEGLSGFKEENGMVFPGLSLKGTDNAGTVILDFADLFAEYSTTGLSTSDFNSRIASNFILTGSEFKNPLHCELIIWDKKSDAKVKTVTDIVIE